MNYIEKIKKERAKTFISPFAANDNIEQAWENDYFGIDNIRNFPACLDLRFANGSRVAIPYSFITGLNYSIDGGIEITTTQNTIKITGRNLEKLFDYLVAYRVRFIKTAIGTMTNEENGLLVECIEVE